MAHGRDQETGRTGAWVEDFAVSVDFDELVHQFCHIGWGEYDTVFFTVTEGVFQEDGVHFAQ